MAVDELPRDERVDTQCGDDGGWTPFLCWAPTGEAHILRLFYQSGRYGFFLTGMRREGMRNCG